MVSERTCLEIPSAIRNLNRKRIVHALRQERLISRLHLYNDRLMVMSVTWKDYWSPAMRFFSADTRLVHRLNRFKKAWRSLLRYPNSRRHQVLYCWRYFSLLHHCLILARKESQRGSCIPPLRCIVGFETFVVEEVGRNGKAAATIASRNPLYLLSRLAPSAPLPTAKHVPLVLPYGCNEPFCHYRKLTFTGRRNEQLLLFPSVRLKDRPASFRVINRLSQAMRWNPDPYYDSRARRLAIQVLGPLVNAHYASISNRKKCNSLRMLDLGAGTGQFMTSAWQSLYLSCACDVSPSVSMHFVDATGRQPVGLRRNPGKARVFKNIEWTAADYRELVDDTDWFVMHGVFDMAILSKVLDCCSVFSIERVKIPTAEKQLSIESILPSYCLSPQRGDQGISQLALRIAKQHIGGGYYMPQWSLSEYFAAMRAILLDNLKLVNQDAQYLPVQRFNPASLITKSGSSVIGELLRTVQSIIIDDNDLAVNDLQLHRDAFGLPGTAAVQMVGDATGGGSKQFVITAPAVANRLKGHRLW